jgi:hypothetical protein
MKIINSITLLCLYLRVAFLNAFLLTKIFDATQQQQQHHHNLSQRKPMQLFVNVNIDNPERILSEEKNVKINNLLSDLPTPTLLIEMSLAESAIKDTTGYGSLDDFLRRHINEDNTDNTLEGCLFVHTKIIDTSRRDKVNQQLGSGKSLSIGLCDATPNLIKGGAYLGIGLANHHVGGYYWARGMGMGASLPAHGVGYRGISSEVDDNHGDEIGELFWKKRGPGLDARETTEESSNSNDGKRSEWADFLNVGDTVQLIPLDATKLLLGSPFQRLVGVRRLGRPLGADPIVERIWMREADGNGLSSWTVCEQST